MDILSPVDSRYRSKTRPLCQYFSEQAWIKYRIVVELLYFRFLWKTIPELKNNINKDNLNFFLSPNVIDYEKIGSIENEVSHDIKAIEIYLRDFYDTCKIGDPKYKEFIHFGLTSQDVNSIAFSLQFKQCIEECIKVKINTIKTIIQNKSNLWKKIVMVSYTHGQPAIPTTLGKEMLVFVERLNFCLKKLNDFEFYTKIGGAVGTCAAHYECYPEIDWVSKLEDFCNEIKLKRWKHTTQITNYEDLIECMQILTRVNSILIDFCQDIWLYISRDIFKLQKELNQVGSSTMPQKVNPIDFENAEGNLKVSNAGFNLLISKLPISRYQRDLTDSTTLRNTGLYFGNMYIALMNIERGLGKIEPNLELINKNLENNPTILSEAVQCILRKHGVENAYEIIRKATQGVHFKSLKDFKDKILENIESSEIRDSIIKLDYNYLGSYKFD